MKFPAAIISDCDQYRYLLAREVEGGNGGYCVFIMLNPSTADHETDDATIRRCIGFTKSWGFSTLVVLNVYAYRATNPKDLVKAKDMVGPENWKTILKTVQKIKESGKPFQVVCAWGNNVQFHAGILANDLRKEGLTLHALSLSKQGEPVHPLYQPNRARPFEWRG